MDPSTRRHTSPRIDKDLEAPRPLRYHHGRDGRQPGSLPGEGRHRGGPLRKIPRRVALPPHPGGNPMSNRRVAIVAGCRTPFARSGTVYRDLTAVDLAKACVRELLERTEVDPSWIGTVVMGQVIPSVKAPNLAPRGGARRGAAEVGPGAHRQPGLRLRQPGDRGGRVRDPARPRGGGDRRRGGEPLRRARSCTAGAWRRSSMEAQRARSLGARLSAILGLRPRDLVPEAPAIAEPSTGLTMGQSAEKMAKENAVTREEQDRIALALAPARLGGDRGRPPARRRSAPCTCPRATRRR